MAAKEEQLAALDAALAEQRHVVRGLFAPQEEGKEFAFTAALREEVELAFEQGMVRTCVHTVCVYVCKERVDQGIDWPVFLFLYLYAHSFSYRLAPHHINLQEVQGEREQALSDLSDLLDVSPSNVYRIVTLLA